MLKRTLSPGADPNVYAYDLSRIVLLRNTFDLRDEPGDERGFMHFLIRFLKGSAVKLGQNPAFNFR